MAIFFFLMFIYFWEKACARAGRGKEKGEQRIRSGLYVDSSEPNEGLKTYKLWDHDLSWSWTLNRLTHPGAPTFLWLFFLMFVYSLREREREREHEHEEGRGRERETQNLKLLQALSCQHRDWCGAQTHKPWDHDLSRSQMLNQLSHPGAPIFDL